MIGGLCAIRQQMLWVFMQIMMTSAFSDHPVPAVSANAIHEYTSSTPVHFERNPLFSQPSTVTHSQCRREQRVPISIWKGWSKCRTGTSKSTQNKWRSRRLRSAPDFWGIWSCRSISSSTSRVASRVGPRGTWEASACIFQCDTIQCQPFFPQHCVWQSSREVERDRFSCIVSSGMRRKKLILYNLHCQRRQYHLRTCNCWLKEFWGQHCFKERREPSLRNNAYRKWTRVRVERLWWISCQHSFDISSAKVTLKIPIRRCIRLFKDLFW